MSETCDDLLTALFYHYGMLLEVPFKGLSGAQRWRWDAADEARMVAVEYSGFGPGHQWNKGVTRDYEKITEGQLCGWTVVVCNSEIVNSGKCMDYVERALEARGGETDAGRDA